MTPFVISCVCVCVCVRLCAHMSVCARTCGDRQWGDANPGAHL